jgi:predicted transcriptional regulator
MRTPVSFTLAPEVREAIDRIAVSEFRSRSQVVELMLRQSIAAREAALGRAEEALAE